MCLFLPRLSSPTTAPPPPPPHHGTITTTTTTTTTTLHHHLSLLVQEKYLAPLFARVEAKMNPAQRARTALIHASGDMATLIKHLAIRP